MSSESAGSAADLRRFDRRIILWMGRHGRGALQWGLAIIFIWFGALKWVSASPADDLVRRTVYWFRPEFFMPILATWEVAIGVCLLFRPLVRLGLLLLFFQLPGTFLPLVLLPDVCFERFPWVLTMEGQYIVKNLLIIGAALVVGGSMPPLQKTSHGESPCVRAVSAESDMGN